MKRLLKQLVQPQVDYCLTLYLPVGGSNSQKNSNLQRTFTSKVPAVKHLSY